ncbi:MAG: multicopper oxidase domain-containing protein [Thiobacillus sp.]|nr:multicopper oxidase domain-containing protein [Thiobacillus sp.]
MNNKRITKQNAEIAGSADPHTQQATAPHLTRRTFLQGMVASAAALGAGWTSVSEAAKGGASGGSASIRNPLYIPPVAFASSYALQAAPATVDLGGGKFSSVLAYNGSFPGPTLRANNGDVASIAFSNGLTKETTVHWHGMIAPPNMDGHPRDVIAPGASFTYQYPIMQRACLNWYHPHPHMMTGEQVALGLAGAFIINDAEEAALGLPSGSYEIPLVIRDTTLDSKGNLTYTAKSSGFLGNIPLVNGTRDPRLDVDTELYRFRVLCGSNARVFKLALSNGAQFTVIGNDGGLLETAAVLGQIEFSSGERLDLLVDFRGLAVGTKVMLQDLNSGWNLLEFNVTQQVSATNAIPSGPLSTITKLADPVVTREFSFDGMSRINGKVYDINRIDFQVPFGQTERWRFKTGGNAPHPVHVHGASFQVQSRSGGRGVVYPWERSWKDTVLLLDGETVEVLIRFEGYRGLYVMHCHKLEHEDMGMMANFEVI